MKITAVKCHVLLDPGYDVEATSSNQDTIVVRIETDEGLVGIGETDLNAWIARACIEAPGTHTMDRGLGAMLIGMDPTVPERCWEELYVGTAMTGPATMPPTTLGSAPSMPATTMTTLARSKTSRLWSKRWIPATPTS